GKASIRKLAEDGQKLADLRVRALVKAALWRQGATDPKALSQRMQRFLLKELMRPDALEDARRLADEMATEMLFLKPNNERVLAAGLLVEQLRQVQTVSLPPVLRERFPRATTSGGTVSLTARMEGKLPEEMVLVNKGNKPLHNVVIWHYLEVN